MLMVRYMMLWLLGHHHDLEKATLLLVRYVLHFEQFGQIEVIVVEVVVGFGLQQSPSRSETMVILSPHTYFYRIFLWKRNIKRIHHHENNVTCLSQI